MLGKFFKKKAVVVSKAVNKDQMEAVIAASILVAGADGDIDESELSQLTSFIENHDTFKVFGSEIGATIDRYCDILEKSGKRSGKIKLMKEIEDISASDEKEREEVFVLAIDIADADGEIDEAELEVLAKIGKTLGLKVDNYL